MRVRTWLIVLTVLAFLISGSLLVPALADGGGNHQVRNQHFGVSGGNVNDRSARFCCSGTLGALGHPDYGSRLVELIGRRNDETARNLARLYTLQAVREEPRVAELLELAVETTPDRPDSIRIDFAVR